MDRTFQVPMQYCSLSNVTSITSHIQNWVLFLLWLHPFILSGVISPLISSSILGSYRPGSSSFSVLSFCLLIWFMGFSRQEYWSGLPFPSPEDHILSDLSTTICLSWVALHGMSHGFIELDKAVVLGSDWLVFCDCGFSLSALWCPLTDYHLTGVSLTLDVGYLFTWCVSRVHHVNSKAG